MHRALTPNNEIVAAFGPLANSGDINKYSHGPRFFGVNLDEL